MQRMLPVALAAALGCAVPSRAGLPVTRVVVFRDRAEVERSGAVALTAGLNRVDLEGLPWDMAAESVRAFVPDAELKVQRIEITPVHARLVREEEAAELRRGVDRLNAGIGDLTVRARRLREQIAFVGSFNVARPPGDPDKAPVPIAIEPAKWLQTLDFVTNTMQAYGSELAAVNRGIEGATVELEVLTTRLDRLMSKDVKKYKNAAVFLSSSRAREAPLHITYMVDGPQWFPRYEVRADVPSGKVGLVAYGLVRQQTGEDWTGAQVTLSTVDLGVSAELPAVPTTRISPAGMLRAEPVLAVGKLSTAVAAASTARPGESAAAAALLSAEAVGPLQLHALRQTLAEQRETLTGLQCELPSAKGEAAAAERTPPAEARAGIQYRYRQLRELYVNQAAALNSGDYRRFSADNRNIQQLWNTLPPEGQKALAEINDEAIRNQGKAQRLLKSRELEKNLTVPAEAARGLDYRFDALGPANIYSEWVLTRVRYLDVEIDAEFTHESAPLHRELFFLVAGGHNPLTQPLLPGPAAVFVGPDFVGESALPLTGSGTRLRFELGSDRDVVIARRVERRRDTRGFLLRTFRYSYVVTIEAVNHKTQPVKARVLDRYPYATKDDDVDIGGFRASPPPTAVDGSRHRLAWDLTIPPGEKRAITFEYELGYRSSLAVSGQEGDLTW